MLVVTSDGSWSRTPPPRCTVLMMRSRSRNCGLWGGAGAAGVRWQARTQRRLCASATHVANGRRPRRAGICRLLKGDASREGVLLPPEDEQAIQGNEVPGRLNARAVELESRKPDVLGHNFEEERVREEQGAESVASVSKGLEAGSSVDVLLLTRLDHAEELPREHRAAG